MAKLAPVPFTKATRDAIRERIRKAVESEFGSQTAMAKAFKRDTQAHRDARAIAATVAKQLQQQAKPDGREKSHDIKLATVIGIARMTRRRVGWLLTGEEPEFEGDALPRGELAVAFAKRASDLVAADMGVPTVHAVNPDAVLAHALQLLVEEQRRIRAQVAPLQGISEVANKLKAMATLQDHVAASDLGKSLSERLDDAVSVRSPVQFFSEWQRVKAQDRDETAAWRAFLARRGLPDHFDAADVEAWHWLPLMGATGTIGGVPIPQREPSAGKQNRPAQTRRTGGKIAKQGR